MKQFTIVFYECEHQGDLDNYLDDLVDCGAEDISTTLDTDSETAIVETSAKDLKEFEAKFKKTDAYQFSSWANN